LPAPTAGFEDVGTSTAVGFQALANANGAFFNTGVGYEALFSNTTGTYNTAIGVNVLYFNTTGSNNVAAGNGALLFNQTGSFNSAYGNSALEENTTGSNNTAIGYHALQAQSLFDAGNNNTATGVQALESNTGDNNTADGYQALLNNRGSENTAVGDGALVNNRTGSSNTALGQNALSSNVSGSSNAALGQNAGFAVTNAHNVTCIGAGAGGGNVNNSTWIGNVYGVTTLSETTAQVIVSDGGQLGIVASSERFKKDIATMEKASEAILSLRPVTFHYKTDTKGTAQFGLIAEEVAKVNPALVLPDKEGKPFTVRYDAVNAMLLNEFLKEHRTVQELKSIVAKQEATAAQQQKQIEALTTTVQKVSAQLEVIKPAPQTVENNR